jgi:S1-C subfamily serine protease
MPGHSLKLKSNAASGITVIKIYPDSLWGLQRGDVITAVDGQPVRHVSQLLEQLRASQPAAVKVQVLRKGDLQVVTIAASDYGRVVSPASPTPASPLASPND